MKIEDLIIWKAFLHVAKYEVPYSPARVPKLMKFRKKMYITYYQGIKDENSLRVYAKLPNKPFEARTMASMLSRYNNAIGPEVLRFMTVTKTIQKRREKLDEAFLEECCYKFKKKYGRIFMYKLNTHDGDLISYWKDNILLDDPEVILLELSDTFSIVSNFFNDVMNALISYPEKFFNTNAQNRSSGKGQKVLDVKRKKQKEARTNTQKYKLIGP